MQIYHLADMRQLGQVARLIAMFDSRVMRSDANPSIATPQVWGKAVSLPGRALAPVIERLKPAGMAEVDAAALAAFHSNVVASLTGGGDKAEVDSRLAEALPALKRLAGLGGGGGGTGSEARPTAAAEAEDAEKEEVSGAGSEATAGV